MTELYLLDTNVVSEFRRKKPHGAVIKWLEEAEGVKLQICAYTIAEIQIGIEKTRQTNQEKALELEEWLDTITNAYPVIALDENIMRLWAKLIQGKSTDLREDAMIAATALKHGLIVVTRNEKDFKQFGIKVLNPFKAKS